MQNIVENIVTSPLIQGLVNSSNMDDRPNDKQPTQRWTWVFSERLWFGS